MVFLEIEGVEVAAGADGFVVNRIKGEVDGGNGVAAELVTNDIVKGDLATDVFVGLEGVGVTLAIEREQASG